MRDIGGGTGETVSGDFVTQAELDSALEGIAASDSFVSATITNLATLAAVATTGLTVPVVRLFVNTDAGGASQTWQLRASTAATVTGSVQRPTDYNGSTNAKVWFLC